MKAVSYVIGSLAILIALAAGYYSFAQSTSYIDVNLGASQTWYIIAIMAIIVEIMAFPMITHMLHARKFMAVASIPFLLLLIVAAVSVSIYLEGGKASQVLSDAKASRSVDATLSAGHSDSLKKLLATQKKLIDSRRVDQAKVNELNKKIQEQAKWARQTAVSELNPMIGLVSKTTGFSKESVGTAFLMLIVGFPMFIKMFFGHVGLIMLTTPHETARRVPEKAPIPSEKPGEGGGAPTLTEGGGPAKQPGEGSGGGGAPQRLGSTFTYDDDNVIRLEKVSRKKKSKKKPFLSNQDTVKEFLEAHEGEEFRPSEGWTMFKEEYPHCMKENQYYAAMKALAQKGLVRRKKINGQNLYEVAKAA